MASPVPALSSCTPGNLTPGADEAASRCKEELRCAKFVHRDNDFSPRKDNSLNALPVNELIVWGGVVANCGEDNLSSLVFKNSEILETVVYCPDRTKGGCLIRPGYFRGDRSLELEFGKLRDLSIRLSPALLPQEYGWITPELRHLRLLSVITALQCSRDGGNRGTSDSRLPDCHSLRRWLSVSTKDDLPCALLAACPKLESITIALCSTADTQCTQTDWIELLPPKPLPWSTQKLLLLPLLKPASQNKGAVSPLSSLCLNIVKIIFAFLGRPRWQYRDHEVPVSIVEGLGLPPAFFSNLSSRTIIDGTFEGKLL